jgi:tetratricopeptide (TPR) repeat protein
MSEPRDHTDAEGLSGQIELLDSTHFDSLEDRYRALAVLLESSAFEVAPADERATVLSDAGATLARLAEERDDREAWVAAVALLERAYADAPVEDSLHGMLAIEISNLLGKLYNLTKDPQIWRRGVAHAQQAGEVVPGDDWRAPLYALAQAVLLFWRAQTTRDVGDVEQAVGLLEGARSGVRPGSGVFNTASTYLARLRFERYGETSEPAYLEGAIRDASLVVAADRALPPERFQSLGILVEALSERFRVASGTLEELEVVVRIAHETVGLAESDGDRALALTSLGATLRQRFHLTRDRADLDQAIEAYKAAVEAAKTHRDAGTRALILDNYGNGLFERHELDSRPEDLEAAIAVSRSALALLPETSPDRARILKNLGISLHADYELSKDVGKLEAAIEALRAGSELQATNPQDQTRLLAILGVVLVQRAALGAARSDPSVPTVELLTEGLDAFDRADGLLHRPSALPVDYALGQQQVWSTFPGVHIGALLWRAALTEEDASAYLRRALEIGEGTKSRLLTEDLSREVPPPPEVPSNLQVEEQWLLAELTSLDASEFAPVRTAAGPQAVRRMERRQEIRRQLEDVWDRMLAVSSSAAGYVSIRRGASGAWLRALDTADADTEYIALFPAVDVHTMAAQGRQEGRVLTVFRMRPGDTAPTCRTTDPGQDPVPDAIRRFEPEVPGDGGIGLRAETWHTSLVPLLRSIRRERPEAQRVVISPPNEGRGLPWHIVLDRAGWSAGDGEPLPVVTLPTLAIVPPAHGADSDQTARWYQPADPARWFGIPDPEHIGASIRVTLHMPGGPSAGEPLVVGNPTGDLPGATDEAQKVAQFLEVAPLIGSEATVDRVRRALRAARVVHLAAHARFDSSSPLASPILLADGTLAVRDLIGEWSPAELVVLSACESGVGALVGGEVAGLAHALLRSGAHGVVASLWPVDDGSTATLMARFYGLLREGVEPAAALARAMQHTREQPDWGHPYFWSGFVLSQGGGAR